MSISGIINTATSGLLTSQAAISVTSSNITNANTVGYTTKSATIATTTVGGQATGVTIVGVGNAVDKALMAEVMDATSTAAYDETIARYLESVLSAIGTTEDGTALESTTTALMTALSDAIAAGGDTAAQEDVISALDDWASALNSASDAVQAARASADDAIGETVESINSLLHQLDELNDQITLTAAAGQSTADLLDQQRVALEELSGYVDITYYTTSTGTLHVYSSGGTALLTSSVHALSYAPEGTMTSAASYEDGTLDGITVDGKDVTGKLGGGALGALITLRDEELPDLQAELDAFATTVMDAVNAASSAASPVPAPNSLTGSTPITASDSFGGSGTLTILTTDADGTVTGSTDIDLSTLSTYQDLIDAIDSVPGVSASLTGDGTLSITADDAGEGVILTGDGTVPSDGASVAHHLGINTLLTGSGASDIAVSGTLSTQGVPQAVPAGTTVGDVAVSSGVTDGLQAVWATLDGPMTFEGAADLSTATRSPVNQVAAVVDDLADRTDAASDTADSSESTRAALATTFTNAYGVNVDEETANLLVYEQSYTMASQVISTARDMFDTLIGMLN